MIVVNRLEGPFWNPVQIQLSRMYPNEMASLLLDSEPRIAGFKKMPSNKRWVSPAKKKVENLKKKLSLLTWY